MTVVPQVLLRYSEYSTQLTKILSVSRCWSNTSSNPTGTGSWQSWTRPRPNLDSDRHWLLPQTPLTQDIPSTLGREPGEALRLLPEPETWALRRTITTTLLNVQLLAARAELLLRPVTQPLRPILWQIEETFWPTRCRWCGDTIRNIQVCTTFYIRQSTLVAIWTRQVYNLFQDLWNRFIIWGVGSGCKVLSCQDFADRQTDLIWNL